MRYNLILVLMGSALSFLAAEETVVVLTDENFYQAVSNKLYIVDFYANWCAPCREFSPNFSVVAEKLKKYNFARVNVDVAAQVARDYNVQYIPYIVAMKDGKVVAQYTGNRTIEDFLDWCKAIIKMYQ